MLGDGSAQAPWQGICGVGAPPPALPAWGAWGGILAPPRAAPRVRTRLPATFRRAQAPNANRWRRPGPAPASRPGGGAGTGFGPALIPVQDLRRPGRGPRCDGCPPPHDIFPLSRNGGLWDRSWNGPLGQKPYTETFSAGRNLEDHVGQRPFIHLFIH